MASVSGQEKLHVLEVFTGKLCSHFPQVIFSYSLSPSRVSHVELQHVNSLSWAQGDVVPILRCGGLRRAVRQIIYRILVLFMEYSVLFHLPSLFALHPVLCVLL